MRTYFHLPLDPEPSRPNCWWLADRVWAIIEDTKCPPTPAFGDWLERVRMFMRRRAHLRGGEYTHSAWETLARGTPEDINWFGEEDK